jgi:hypothetical protein
MIGIDDKDTEVECGGRIFHLIKDGESKTLCNLSKIFENVSKNENAWLCNKCMKKWSRGFQK